MKQKFQYKLANVNMHKVYSLVISEFKKIPEIMVYEELEDGNNILRYRIRSGKDIIFLKKADDMIHVLRNELKENKAPAYFDLDWSWHHELEDEEVAMWCKVVLLLSEALNVNCPQVHFSSRLGGDAVALEECGTIVLPDFNGDSARMMIMIIAHELRHIWQSVYQPELQADYVYVEDDDNCEAYELHPCEIDAEAFAMKIAETVWPVEAFGSENLKALEAAMKRKDEIDVSLKDETKLYLKALGELEDQE